MIVHRVLKVKEAVIVCTECNGSGGDSGSTEGYSSGGGSGSAGTNGSVDQAGVCNGSSGNCSSTEGNGSAGDSGSAKGNLSEGGSGGTEGDIGGNSGSGVNIERPQLPPTGRNSANFTLTFVQQFLVGAIKMQLFVLGFLFVLSSALPTESERNEALKSAEASITASCTLHHWEGSCPSGPAYQRGSCDELKAQLSRRLQAQAENSQARLQAPALSVRSCDGDGDGALTALEFAGCLQRLTGAERIFNAHSLTARLACFQEFMSEADEDADELVNGAELLRWSLLSRDVDGGNNIDNNDQDDNGDKDDGNDTGDNGDDKVVSGDEDSTDDNGDINDGDDNGDNGNSGDMDDNDEKDDMDDNGDDNVNDDGTGDDYNDGDEGYDENDDDDEDDIDNELILEVIDTVPGDSDNGDDTNAE
ncbi:EF-Hand 1 calcium-binding site [Trinorchestia longiramus]|nr:EF-Hand 1 calcium-binding site [Trinorchestia longiramus]